MIELAPACGEPELSDPALTGEWADALAELSKVESVPPWCSYAARREGSLVGMGGFKGPPDADGQAEIAYISFIPARSQGTATEIAAALVAIARQEGALRLIAHTMPEVGASTRVLENNQFVLTGEVEDPEDGRVWRWELRLRD